MRSVFFFLIIVASITLGTVVGAEIASQVYSEWSLSNFEARIPYVLWGAVGGGAFSLVLCYLYARLFPASTAK